MSKKIVHIAPSDKFMPSYIIFLNKNFNLGNHLFLLTNGISEKDIPSSPNIHISKKTIASRLNHYFRAIVAMQKSDKIILHGLFDPYLIYIIFFMPWLYRKSYWLMWGGDLYKYRLNKKNIKWHINEFFRRPLIKNIGHLVTYIPGDISLAREWYGAKGNYHECIMYPSNTYKALDVSRTIKKNATSIQIGNSADPSNNHIEILDKLLPFKDQNIKIYIPLSYGNKSYAKKVIAKGKELFGDKFIALTDFMPLEQYLEFLGTIDIAIFNHKRQQAMGNTITLLGLGKTVFIRSDTTQWQFFKAKNIKVYDSLNLASLEKKEHLDNIQKVKEYFSKETLIKQYSEIF